MTLDWHTKGNRFAQLYETERGYKMATNKFFGKCVTILFYFLIAGFLLAVMVPDASANGSDAVAWVFIPDQLVDVDGDGQQESMGARFSLTTSGAVVGSAIIHDGEVTIVYEFTSGGIACDRAGVRYIQLESNVISQESGQQINRIGNYTMTLKSNNHSGTLIWDNRWNDASAGFELQGQMYIFESPCSLT